MFWHWDVYLSTLHWCSNKRFILARQRDTKRADCKWLEKQGQIGGKWICLTSFELAGFKCVGKPKTCSPNVLLLIIRSFFSEQKATQEKIKTWKDKNALRSRESCQYLLRRLKVQYLDPVLERVSSGYSTTVRYDDITRAMDTIKNEFHRRAFGARSVRADEFYKFNQVKKWIDLDRKKNPPILQEKHLGWAFHLFVFVSWWLKDSAVLV